MPWSLDTCSTKRSPVHRVQLHGASNRDTHLFPHHNNSSVLLTKTTYMWRSERIMNGTRSGRTTPPEHTPLNDPPKKSLGPAQPSPHRCRTFPLLPVQMGYGLLCGLRVWHRTNCRPCRPPLSNPTTLPRTTRSDGSGR